MRNPRLLPALLAALAVLLAGACLGGGGEGEPPPTATPEVTATPEGSATPEVTVTPERGAGSAVAPTEPSATTSAPSPEITRSEPRVPHQPSGDAGVDAVVRAVYEGDVGSLERSFQGVEITCAAVSSPAWRGACPEGAEEDDPVLVLPRMGCEASLLLPEQAADLVRSWVRAKPVLHSVAFAPGSYWPRATFIVNFTTERNEEWRYSAFAVAVEGDAIVALSAPWCIGGEGAESLYPPGYVLPPTSPMDPPDPTRRSGIAVVDRAVDALRSADLQQIAASLDPFTLTCQVAAEDSESAPSPCLPGESETEVVALALCEGAVHRPASAGNVILERGTSADLSLW